MKHTTNLFFILFIAVLLPGACSENVRVKPAAGTDSSKTIKKETSVPVAFSWKQLEQISQQEIDSGIPNGQMGKKIIVEGYLSLPASMNNFGSNMSCDLFPRFNQSKGMLAHLYLASGTGRNQMDSLPKIYSLKDFKVTTNDGQVLGNGAFVKVTGELSGKDEDRINIYLDKIEQAVPGDADYSTAMALNADNMAAAGNKLVYVDGKLEAGFFLGSFTGFNYSLDIKSKQLPPDLKLSGYLKIGSGKGQMEPLPKTFTDKDIRIHDEKGKILPVGKTLRLYGVLEKSITGNGSYYLYVEHIVAQ